MANLIYYVILLGLVYALLSLLPLPAPFSTVLLWLFVLALVVLVLQAFGVPVPSGLRLNMG